MIVYTQPELTDPTSCPYLPGRTLIYEHFFADCLKAREMSWLLSTGWRKFGHYFFRPACPDCRSCIPLRVNVNAFSPSRSQRRAMTKCRDVQVEFGPMRYAEDLYRIYSAHAATRFGESHDFDHFAFTLLATAGPALLSRYTLHGRLVGAGFLDVSADALSSVYYVFDPDFSHLSLGVFSVAREIEAARQRGLEYYYLGYIVTGCPRMAYKGAFHPHELYSWSTNCWT